MTIISKVAGALSTFSALKDVHETSMIYAKNCEAKYSSNDTISCVLRNQTTNTLSPKDTRRKNWLAKNNYLNGISGTIGSVKGYCKGVATSIVRYIPNLLLSAVAIFSKNKTLSYLSTVGIAITELVDFVSNSLTGSRNNNYLK